MANHADLCIGVMFTCIAVVLTMHSETVSTKVESELGVNF